MKKIINSNYFYIVLAILFLVAVYFSKNYFLESEKKFNIFINSNSTISKASSIPEQIALNSTPTSIQIEFTPTPTATPTPTSSPIPTVESKPAGYCLNVPVLMYHHIQPLSIAREKGQTSFTVDSGIFDQQMGYLVTNGYTIITSDQLVNALISHTQLPQKSIVVTLDDGYRDIRDYAFPIFQKYGIHASLMIPTGLVGGPDYLSWGQIEEMAGSGLIQYTDHTWSHYSVGRGDINKIKYEIETAKAQLEQHTGQKVTIFTYPYGSMTNETVNILQQDGFTGAFSTNPGTWQCDSYILGLHRTRIGNASLASYGL